MPEGGKEVIDHLARRLLFCQEVAQEVEGLLLDANVIAFTGDSGILFIVADLLEAVADIVCTCVRISTCSPAAFDVPIPSGAETDDLDDSPLST